MFTGIIEALGRVAASEELSGGRRFRFLCSFADELRPDQSVAVNGVCLTVVKVGAGAFDAVAVEETLSKTTLGALGQGDPVNLERAMRSGDRLDGHIVQGHVDATSEILEVAELHDSRLIRISLEPANSSYLIPVGSVAIDGISLTVARLGDRDFSVAIIPHTFEMTNVPTWKPGMRVNLEFDLLGKYVARWMDIKGG